MIEACIPALRRYASVLVRTPQEQDDLVQDCLVRALERWHTQREDGNLRGWLFTIMHNLCVSQIRRNKVRGLLTTIVKARVELTDQLPAKQEQIIEIRKTIHALQKLPAGQQRVLILIAVEDLSYAEAAQVLGIPIGTVMSRLFRARERLRQSLDEKT